MQKLSVSLFAVLAIVLAVSSAFTSLKRARTDYRMWVFDHVPDATQAAFIAAPDNPGLPTKDDKYNFVEAFTPTINAVSNSTQSIPAFLSENFRTCFGSIDICVVKILEDPAHPSTYNFGEVIDVAFGDFQ